jgi:hypothetical protein
MEEEKLRSWEGERLGSTGNSEVGMRNSEGQVKWRKRR